MDKFKLFNKIKIDLNEYEAIDNYDNENLKIKMQQRLKLSKRNNRRRKVRNTLIAVASSLVIIMVGSAVVNPSIAEVFAKKLPQFETMLDKIKIAIEGEEDSKVTYNPSVYPEIEEEKYERKNNKLQATAINVSSKNDDMEITIDKALYDKKKLFLSMTLKTDKPFKETGYTNATSDSPYGDGEIYIKIDILDIYINDVKLDCYAWSSGVIEFIDENTAEVSFLVEDLNSDQEEADFKINLTVPKSNLYEQVQSTFLEDKLSKHVESKYSFDFNIKSIDDNTKSILVNKKDGDYTLKKVTVTDTYIEIQTELPFEPSLNKPHNNFIIVTDDKGRELEMSSSNEGKVCTQIHELINIGERPKYIDVCVYKDNDAERVNPISCFRVDLE